MGSQSLLSLVWLLPLLVLVLVWEPAPPTESNLLPATADIRMEPELPGGPLNHPLSLQPTDPNLLMQQYQKMGPMFVAAGWVYLADDRDPEQIRFRRLHPEFPVSGDDPRHLAEWRQFYHATEWGEWGQPLWLKRSVPTPLDKAFTHHPICRQYRCMVELNLNRDATLLWREQLRGHLASGVSAELRGGSGHQLLVLTLNPRH